MFVTPAQAGVERKRRAFVIPAFAEWQEATLAAPVRGSRQPTAKLSSGGRARAPCRHPRADNGEPAFAG